MIKPLYKHKKKVLNQFIKVTFTLLAMFLTDFELGGGVNVN